MYELYGQDGKKKQIKYKTDYQEHLDSGWYFTTLEQAEAAAKEAKEAAAAAVAEEPAPEEKPKRGRKSAEQ